MSKRIGRRRELERNHADQSKKTGSRFCTMFKSSLHCPPDASTLILELHQLDQVARGVIENGDDRRADVGWLHSEINALCAELFVLGLYVLRQELGKRNTVFFSASVKGAAAGWPLGSSRSSMPPSSAGPEALVTVSQRKSPWVTSSLTLNPKVLT